MTAPELKPCPFCGGKATFKPRSFKASCDRCGAHVPCGSVSSLDVIAVWNRRSTDPAAIREAALMEARRRVNDLVAERQADLHGARNDFNRGAVDALQEACAAILALIPKGAADDRA